MRARTSADNAEWPSSSLACSRTISVGESAGRLPVSIEPIPPPSRRPAHSSALETLPVTVANSVIACSATHSAGECGASPVRVREPIFPLSPATGFSLLVRIICCLTSRERGSHSNAAARRRALAGIFTERFQQFGKTRQNVNISPGPMSSACRSCFFSLLSCPDFRVNPAQQRARCQVARRLPQRWRAMSSESSKLCRSSTCSPHCKKSLSFMFP